MAHFFSSYGTSLFGRPELMSKKMTPLEKFDRDDKDQEEIEQMEKEHFSTAYTNKYGQRAVPIGLGTIYQAYTKPKTSNLTAGPEKLGRTLSMVDLPTDNDETLRGRCRGVSYLGGRAISPNESTAQNVEGTSDEEEVFFREIEVEDGDDSMIIAASPSSPDPGRHRMVFPRPRRMNPPSNDMNQRAAYLGVEVDNESGSDEGEGESSNTSGNGTGNFDVRQRLNFDEYADGGSEEEDEEEDDDQIPNEEEEDEQE